MSHVHLEVLHAIWWKHLLKVVWSGSNQKWNFLTMAWISKNSWLMIKLLVLLTMKPYLARGKGPMGSSLIYVVIMMWLQKFKNYMRLFIKRRKSLMAQLGWLLLRQLFFKKEERMWIGLFMHLKCKAWEQEGIRARVMYTMNVKRKPSLQEGSLHHLQSTWTHLV